MIRLLFLTACNALPALGQYISHDPFSDYVSGMELPVAGNPAVAGYTGGWTDVDFGDAEPAIAAGSLAYGNTNYAGSSGQRVAKGADVAGISAGNSGRVYRELEGSLRVSDSSSGTLYLSWLFRTGNENAAANADVYQTLALYQTSTADANRCFEAGVASGDFGTPNYGFRMMNSNSLRGNMGVARDSNVHLFVVRFNLGLANNSDSATVWIDPVLNGTEPSGGITRSGFNLRFDRLALSDYASNSSAWDEIRWGTSFASVTVLPAQPFIRQQPVAYSGHVGDTVDLVADIICNPAPTYQWQMLQEGTWTGIPGATQATLTIASAPFTTNGSYRVVASNSNGSVTSDTVPVSLTYPPPAITAHPTPAGVEAGAPVSFSVTATGLGNLTYQWLKDGDPLPGQTAATFSIPSVNSGHTGVYSVRIIDDAAVASGLEPVSVVSDPAILLLGNLADREAGLTFRLFDIRETMDQLYPLVPGQTPNVDQKRATVDWSGAVAFAGYVEKFLVECSADLFITSSGIHEFQLTSSDGSALRIGGNPVVTHDGVHAATVAMGSVNLTAGLHPLSLRMFKDSGNPVLKLEWRRPGEAAFEVVPASAYLTTAGVTRVVAPGKKNVIRPGDGTRPGSGQPLDAIHPSWRVTTIHPSGFNPKVGAMAVHPSSGKLLITTFNPNQNSTPDPLPGGDGKVWALGNVQGEDPQAVTVTEVASGLSEPLGMTFINGELYVTQRTSVTKLRDLNQDGYYETKENIGGGWISNNYHQFHFGLIEKDGFAYSTLSTSIHFDYPGLNGPNPPNRGSLVRTNLATGAVSYLAGGLRTPNGLCFGPEGEIFQTDNQGAWQPTSRLNHLKEGHFYGHYNSTSGGGSPSLFADQPMTPPAVWFPQNEVANSPSQPLSIPDGPFAGDLLVGDITLGGINRVSLEKVRGVWQGCIYRFTQGLEAGVNRLAWGPGGSLYVGCIGGSGNWSWNGTQTGLQRLTPKSGAPVTFEIAKVSVTADGFEIAYTKPMPAAVLGNPANFTVKQWSYEPTAAYGGAKIGEEALTVQTATASEDRTKVRLVIPGVQKGHVVYLKTDPVSDDGSAILSSEAWYTLNEMPGGPYGMTLDSDQVEENLEAGTMVGKLAAEHDRSGEAITFTLPQGVRDNSFFRIEGDELRTSMAFDHERRSSFRIRVRATDGVGRTVEEEFTIFIGDQAVENLPTAILLSNSVLPPDHAAGALVGRMLVDDADLGDLQAYSVVAGVGTALIHEPFDYGSGTQLDGQAGGMGFASSWNVAGTASIIPAGGLSFTDAQGNGLDIAGQRAVSQAASRNHRTLASPRGADGTTTYISFVAAAASNVHFWGVEFWNGDAVDGNRVLQLGNENGFGVRVRNGANKFFPGIDSLAHFYVMKIEHLVGNDRVSAWIDPLLASEASPPDLVFSPAEVGGSIAFNRMGFSNYVTAALPTVDEIRLGESWASVTPHSATFPRFEFAAGQGDADNDVFAIRGNELLALGVLPAGLRTVRVKVTDSTGHSFEQSLLIWIGSGSADSNGDGITDGDAVRMGTSPLAVLGGNSYFGALGNGSSIMRENGQFNIVAAAVPGNVYWLESSEDLKQWKVAAGSASIVDSFQETHNRWQINPPATARHFWRAGGGWPVKGGVNPLANGLGGITFVGGSAGWTYDAQADTLNHVSASPSEWVQLGSYGDFFLSLDYRLSSGGNAGIFLRAAATGDPWITGSEIQVTNEPRLPIHSTGSVYDRIPARPAADARHSVWHRMEILMTGYRLRVAVDGVVTVDADDVRQVYPSFAWPLSGLIGLQNSHSSGPGTVAYRNVRIVSLDP
jgi:glucose/arabinose dehydrogenase